MTQIEHADTSTLDGTRYILTVKNEHSRLRTTGSLTPDTEVICLCRNDFGYYMPCVAYVVKAGKRVTVDLYHDRSERVTVSLKAILWPNGHNSDQKEMYDDRKRSMRQ